jgi:hypothetical protein
VAASPRPGVTWVCRRCDAGVPCHHDAVTARRSVLRVGMPLLGSGDEVGDGVGVAVVHLGQHGGVDVRGGDDGGVPVNRLQVSVVAGLGLADRVGVSLPAGCDS